VEVEVDGGWLHIRPRPLNFGRGQDVQLEQIERVQVESGYNYRIQFVNSEGFGLLPMRHSLAGIPTQDEASTIAAFVAQLFGIKFVPGIQPTARPSPSLGDDQAFDRQEKELKSDTLLKVDTVPRKIDGYIRIKKADNGVVVSYIKSWKNRIIGGVFALIWLSFTAFFMINIMQSPGEMELSVSTPISNDETMIVIDSIAGKLIALLPFSGCFWIFGIVMLVSVSIQDEFNIKGGDLIYRKRLITFPLTAMHISLAQLEKVGTAVAWDSYNNMYFRVIARIKDGDDLVLIRNLPEANGHTLCQALHKHLGVPV
jgi:hypothetical protein